jgi:hypothetical protein
VASLGAGTAAIVAASVATERTMERYILKVVVGLLLEEEMFESLNEY